MKISNELMHDADFGQGIIRIFLGTGVLLYTIWYLESYAGQMNLFLLYLAVGFFLFSIINLVSFWVLNVPILLRRSVCIFIDTGIVTFSMAVFGEAATPFFGGYLWVTIANGIRFGRRYLYITWALSIIGFILVLSISRYWQAHLILGIGILIWIILLPLYVSKLLKNLEQTVAREKQANSVKSQFLANMSHELRTPLNTIIGYTELLEEDARDEKNTQLGEDLGKIKHAAFHLLNLINGVLDLSKIESGKMDVHYEEVELALLGAEVLELIQNQVGKNNSTIELKIADGLHKTYTDYTKLKQVLLNLLSNAAKFTHDGKIALAMNKLHRAGCDWLEIKISDTGIGIDAGYLPHLFEPFMQADSSTTQIG
ncbi:MAG: HAMP domain-containing histidine kinase, partial [Gammaproteobacteria bacterium]|nr:HAMP domain-containing histidine kinase [Gammaproteobacteria bacterium]